MLLQMQESDFFQLSTSTALLLLVGFYGLTFLLSLTIGKKKENVDGYMVSNNAIGFGLSAASMIATWIWAASFYASATSGYRYGLSGPIHYGLRSEEHTSELQSLMRISYAVFCLKKKN